MAKTPPPFTCTECQSPAAKWSGQCGSCGAWNTLVELTATSSQTATEVTTLASVSLADGVARPTGVDEFDRLFGGGLLPGSVTLLYGEPGAGKSTLLSQVAIAAASRGTTVLLVAAEESAAQVRLRTERLGTLPDQLLIIATTSLDEALHAVSYTHLTLPTIYSV